MALLSRPTALLAAAMALMPALFAQALPVQAQSSRDSEGFPPFPGVPPGFGSSHSTMPRPDERPRRRRDETAQPSNPQTPADKAAAIAKALAPRPPLATVRKQTLDDLYVKLAAAADEDEAKGLADLIGSIWMRTASDTASLLMSRAVAAIEAKNYPLALQVLDRLVVLQPSWSEAWNKRASVRYFAGDLDGSMADVDRVLKLEPRHFGALDGLAAILQRTGFPKRALEVYRRTLAIYPHQPGVEKMVQKLTLEVEGQGI